MQHRVVDSGMLPELAMDRTARLEPPTGANRKPTPQLASGAPDIAQKIGPNEERRSSAAPPLPSAPAPSAGAVLCAGTAVAIQAPTRKNQGWRLITELGTPSIDSGQCVG